MDAKSFPYTTGSDASAIPTAYSANPPSAQPSAGNVPAQPGPTEPVDSAAKRMVAQLLKYNYHPVILCGTSSAGKTTMLLSLCAFLKKTGEFDVQFGEWHSSGSAQDDAKLDDARKFYNKKLQEFQRGLGPEGSAGSLPYIIPIKITPTRNDLAKINTSTQQVEPVRLAFMDMAGEWFKPISEDRLTQHQLSDVQKLLFHYDRSVSLLLLAPPTAKDGYTQNESQFEPWEKGTDFEKLMHHPDTALRNALSLYNTRPSKRNDRLLFLLTKWDLAVKEGVDSPVFSEPSRTYVEAELTSRFSDAWSAFKAMRISPNSKWMTQYCAGVIKGRDITTLEEGTAPREAIDRYAKVLWNWLYRGATRDAQCPEGLLLFPNLLPKPPLGLAARFAQRLGR